MSNTSSLEKTAVALSGGVDSSVSALLLLREGRQVSGVFAKSWEDDSCPAREDFVTAAAVAEKLGIDIDLVDLTETYRSEVFAGFLREYERGRTPNPDVWCNERVKFGGLAAHVLGAGFGEMATGHYARIVRRPDGTLGLCKGEDPHKDQSYFLYRLGQEQLSRALFPVGEMMKEDVRELARKEGLPNWDRKDSTGICFIGERKFDDFLARHLPRKEGEMRDPEGKVVGAHQGVWFHTVGQRKGLGIGGDGDAWYVAAKDAGRNELTVVQGREHPLLLGESADLEDTSWVAGRPPKQDWVYTARIRHGQYPQACTLPSIGEGECSVRFAAPQWAMAPGQSVVVYDGNVCLGGGVIR